MMSAKHKFFDSPADTQPSYREVSRYSTNSVLNTHNNQISTETENGGRTVISLLKAAVPLMFRAEKGGTNDT